MAATLQDVRQIVAMVSELGPERFRLETCPTTRVARERLAREPVDVVVVLIESENDWSRLTEIRPEAYGLPIVVLSRGGSGVSSAALLPIRGESRDYLVKRGPASEVIARGLLLAVERRQEEEIRQAREAVDEALRAGRRSTAVLGHEIHGAIATVVGFTELLLDSDLDEGQRALAERLHRAAVGLNDLSCDLFDLSFLEAGAETPRRLEFDLRDLIVEVVDSCEPDAAKKGLRLDLEMHPPLPRRVVGDPVRLRQILVNLVGNAIKFTERGLVSVHVAPDVICGQVWFAVTDSGIGIPEDRQEAVFEMFAQSDPSIRERFGGTGIGLALCKSFVERMDGRIWVESEVGTGSSFQFTVVLPAARRMPELETVPALTDSGSHLPFAASAPASER